MSCYDYFKDDENATVLIKSLGVATLDANYQPVYGSPVTIYNSAGIFYELGASEQVSRQQIQKSATAQVILDPELVTTKITEVMQCFITTVDETAKEYRIVTEVNPLNKDEAVIIDLVED